MSTQAFTRTPLGLSNQALFLGVDIVVFAESGSRTLSLNEIDQGLENEETSDSRFWRTVLDSFAPTERAFHIKTVGSKTSVRAIAEMIAQGTVTKVVAAMDRDLDHYSGVMVVHTNVLYTRGYSWENDVWTPSSVNAVFRSIVPDRKHRQHAENEINSFFLDLERCFRSSVRIDRNLVSIGCRPTDRESVMSTVRPSLPGPPKLLRNDLGAVIAETRQRVHGLRRHPYANDILLDLHGHTLARAAVSLLQWLLQSLTNYRLNNDALTSMALTQFMGNHQSTAHQYYSEPVRKIAW